MAALRIKPSNTPPNHGADVANFMRRKLAETGEEGNTSDAAGEFYTIYAAETALPAAGVMSKEVGGYLALMLATT